MKPRPNFFRISKTQQRGLILLILIVLVVEILLLYKSKSDPSQTNDTSQDWKVFQAQIDSLKSIQAQKEAITIYPFNPNFLTKYRGYVLGMSPQEVQRMIDFRKQKKFVNTAKEFQRITQISDSLLAHISPYLKFPKWVTASKQKFVAKPLIKKPLNTATAEDLKKVYGVGNVLADRIIQFRNVIGGFVIADQLQDVFGLEDATIINILSKFEVKNPPNLPKININTASINELNEVPYITYSMAREIVVYRSQHGNFNSFEEIEQLEGFYSKKTKRIALYLYLENSDREDEY